MNKLLFVHFFVQIFSCFLFRTVGDDGSCQPQSSNVAQIERNLWLIWYIYFVWSYVKNLWFNRPFPHFIKRFQFICIAISALYRSRKDSLSMQKRNLVFSGLRNDMQKWNNDRFDNEIFRRKTSGIKSLLNVSGRCEGFSSGLIKAQKIYKSANKNFLKLIWKWDVLCPENWKQLSKKEEKKK